MFFSQTSESVVFELTYRKFDERLSFLLKYIGIDISLFLMSYMFPLTEISEMCICRNKVV